MKILLISGKIGAGKSELCKIIQRKLEEKSKRSVKMSFAKPLKDTCKEAFRPLTDQLNDICKKEMDFPEDYLTKDENWYAVKNFYTRAILQIVGTDIVRNIDPDYWVKTAAKYLVKDYLDNEETVYVFDDARFPNELKIMEFVQQELLFDPRPDGHTIFKIKLSRTSDNKGIETQHSSENQLEGIHWDMDFYNDGSIQDLETKADDIIYMFELDK